MDISYINQLPIEIVENIFDSLDVADIFQLFDNNLINYYYSTDDRYWRERLYRDMPRLIKYNSVNDFNADNNTTLPNWYMIYHHIYSMINISNNPCEVIRYSVKYKSYAVYHYMLTSKKCKYTVGYNDYLAFGLRALVLARDNNIDIDLAQIFDRLQSNKEYAKILEILKYIPIKDKFIIRNSLLIESYQNYKPLFFRLALNVLDIVADRVIKELADKIEPDDLREIISTKPNIIYDVYDYLLKNKTSADKLFPVLLELKPDLIIAYISTLLSFDHFDIVKKYMYLMSDYEINVAMKTTRLLDPFKSYDILKELNFIDPGLLYKLFELPDDKFFELADKSDVEGTYEYTKEALVLRSILTENMARLDYFIKRGLTIDYSMVWDRIDEISLNTIKKLVEEYGLPTDDVKSMETGLVRLASKCKIDSIRYIISKTGPIELDLEQDEFNSIDSNMRLNCTPEIYNEIRSLLGLDKLEEEYNKNIEDYSYYEYE